MQTRLFFLIVIAITLAACGSPAAEPSATAPADLPAITPYFTLTPPQTAVPTATLAFTSTPPPLPTPTPFLYTVVETDTMIGIAARFGLTLDELTLANPEVNPNFLSVGTLLTIPLPSGDEDGEQTTASLEILPLQTGEVTCIPNQIGGLWCLWPVTNDQGQPVENLAGLVRFFDAAGDEVLTEPVYSLLNILPAGAQLPLAVYIAPPLPEWESVQAQLTSASAALQVETRYIPVNVNTLKTTPLDDDSLSWQVSGALVLDESAVPETIWVAAVAYSTDGSVVGLRRWEAPADQLASPVSFTFQIYSLGAPIDRVEVFAEAPVN